MLFFSGQPPASPTARGFDDGTEQRVNAHHPPTTEPRNNTAGCWAGNAAHAVCKLGDGGCYKETVRLRTPLSHVCSVAVEGIYT